MPDQEWWGIIELFGHVRIAGRISEHTLGGKFIRVDVPETDECDGYTKLIGPSAVYAITFVDKLAACAAAENIIDPPIQALRLEFEKEEKENPAHSIRTLPANTEDDEIPF